MAELGRFFDGPFYGAQDFAEFYKNFLETGYFDGLSITANNTMETTVNIGSAFVEGHEYRNTALLNLTHNVADITYNRIDRVVVRLDRSPDVEQPLKAMVRAGTPSASPIPPALIRDAYIYEISLAQILVESGKSFIEAYQITDERDDPALCGPSVKNGQLPINYKSNSDLINTYPYGVTSMRINESGGFPSSYGILVTIKVTSVTGSQMFYSTTTNGDVWIRSTSEGVWQSWRRVDGSETQQGTGTVQSSGNDTKSVNVTFPRPYAQTPKVVATVTTSAPNSRAVGVTNVTTTGFTAHVWNGGSALTIAFDWVAKGVL